ncbi:polyadenylate-binding protein [Acrasis kona]|uniref:Polyadenylate-binding protein n=1 Tax=Acrasis kona TaxID=1008807 RepID=A0AAW2Z0Q3_9EUKA
MSKDSELKTLWMGDLEHFMDEESVRSVYGHDVQPHIAQIKIIRDRNTGQPAGYGFVEFNSHDVAKSVLTNYTGRNIPNFPGKVYRLNWATFGTQGGRQQDAGNAQGHQVFVGDLAPDVTDQMLYSTFVKHYPSARSAKVVMDPGSGQTRGYGFVRFDNEHDMRRALQEMQGVFVGSRPIKVSHVTRKNQTGGSSSPPPMSTASYNMNLYAQSTGPPPSNRSGAANNAQLDPNGTVLYVGNLNQDECTEQYLRDLFQPYGQITIVKIPSNNKHCGFVHFVNRGDAERALNDLNGTYLLGNQIRVSWGRQQLRTQTGQPQQPQQTVNTTTAPQPAQAVNPLVQQQTQLMQLQWYMYYQKLQEQQLEMARLADIEKRRFTQPFDVNKANQNYIEARQDYLGFNVKDYL